MGESISGESLLVTGKQKFESIGPSVVLAEYARWQRPGYVQLHLGHVPVIDEDGRRGDYLSVIREILALGYPSVMVDGSLSAAAGTCWGWPMDSTALSPF